MERPAGLDEAVHVLRPHWKAFGEYFEAESRKFMELLQADHSIFGRIIKCHLISEIYMDRYLSDTLAISNFSDIRLTYRQKAMLLPEQGAPPMIIKPGLLTLNKIRNRFAHNLHSEVSVEELQSMKEIMKISGRTVEGIDAIAIIESFTTLACTFLRKAPPDIQEAFARAVGYLAVKDVNAEDGLA